MLKKVYPDNEINKNFVLNNFIFNGLLQLLWKLNHNVKCFKFVYLYTLKIIS